MAEHPQASLHQLHLEVLVLTSYACRPRTTPRHFRLPSRNPFQGGETKDRMVSDRWLLPNVVAYVFP